MNDIKEITEQLGRIEELLVSQKTVLTFNEAVAYMGVSKGHLYKLTSRRQIRHYKPRGKMLYFNRVELDAWLCQNPVKTAAAIEQDAANYMLKNG
ncbi:helix-turn-helix domain-containing protein [Williamwhitmania taraxaci]|uniref:DNA binding domain-containing protein, excisionase family n=1 Tax=Williamwhitmania taraxaci TaxID=1640674 RepID=A0A1G6GG03_9BACT|nr:helix-turn-helix domain-containing protein [Williamwhitmania taraxaci]SDB80952.1 DNA binding domain-containing protein, excisionase family [Williamwhitmania taraxaci]